MLYWRHFKRDLNNLFNDFLYDLRNLDNFLYYPWNNNYLLNNSLNLHTFWHLDYFLYDFLLYGGYFFDLFEVDFLRDDFFLFDYDGNLLSHDEGYILDHLYRFLFSEYNVLDELNRDVFLQLYCFNKGNLVDLGLYFSLGHNHRHLNVFLHLSHFHPCFVNNARHFDLNNLNLLHHFQYFNYDLYFSRRQLHHLLNCNNLLNDLRHLNNLFLNMDHWHYLFHYFLDNLHPRLNVGHVFWHFLIPNHFNDFFNYLRHSHNLFSLYDFFNNFFYNDLDRFDNFFFCLQVAHNFFHHLNNLYLFLYHYLLHFNHHWFLDLHDLLHQHFLRLQFSLLSHLDGYSFIELGMRHNLLGMRNHLHRLLIVQRNRLMGLHD